MIHKLAVGLDYATGHHADPLVKTRYQLCQGRQSDKPRGACSYVWEKVSCPQCLKLGRRQKQLGGSRGRP